MELNILKGNFKRFKDKDKNTKNIVKSNLIIQLYVGSSKYTLPPSINYLLHQSDLDTSCDWVKHLNFTLNTNKFQVTCFSRSSSSFLHIKVLF